MNFSHAPGTSPLLRVLHIAPDFHNTGMYRELLGAIGDAGVETQAVFVPRRRRWLDRPTATAVRETDLTVIDSFDHTQVDRILYWPKVSRSASSLLGIVDTRQYSGIHAHTLFSAGGVARSVAGQLECPYVVSVRATDVDVFFRRMPHLRYQGLQVLRDAAAVLFVTEDLKSTVLRYTPKELRRAIDLKSVTVPNGAHPFWFQHGPAVLRRKIPPDRPARVLFVGRLIKLKNIPVLIDAVAQLNEMGCPTTLRIVGAGPRAGEVTKLVSRRPAFFEISGLAASREELLSHYRWADMFAMVSAPETFGLVYVEAMSQALPIVYLAGHGISAYVRDSRVGMSVDAVTSVAVAEAIRKVISSDEYPQLSENALKRSRDFTWESAAQATIDVYYERFL